MDPSYFDARMKRGRVTYSKSLLQIYDNCELRRLDEVTSDENWVHYYEPGRTTQKKELVPKGGNPPQMAKRTH